MIEYLVFPIPQGLVKVTASSAHTARNKYLKAFPECEDALIIIPASHGNKSNPIIGNEILPLYKCEIKELSK